MKSIEELEDKLVSELYDSLDSIRANSQETGYYNKWMGRTSAFLAALLDSLMSAQTAEWRISGKWIDDSLLTDVERDGDHLAIEGIMIWGKGGTTEQWTEPFYFEIELDLHEKGYNEYIFLFGDQDKSEVDYDYFSLHRHIWDGDQRRWKYFINSSEDNLANDLN